VKIGYQFGNGNGLLVGIEVSTVWENGDRSQGILVDLDYCKEANFIKLNVGVEKHPFPFSSFPVGVSFGPSLMLKNQQFQVGLTTIIYGTLGIIPFFGSTVGLDFSPVFEVGSYLKIPFLISGPGIKSLGG
jgi:hypothetical protein